MATLNFIAAGICIDESIRAFYLSNDYRYGFTMAGLALLNLLFGLEVL